VRLRWGVRVVLLLAVLATVWWLRAHYRWPQVYVAADASMAPTVDQGDVFLAVGPVHHLRRGMLVLFPFEDETGVTQMLRRVAGLPGDTVRLVDGRAVVNGRPEPWPFHVSAPRAGRSPSMRGGNLYTWGPTRVPPDSVLLLADAREPLGRPDSRFIGRVPVSAVEAEARWILWPLRGGRFLKSLRD